MVCRQHFRRLQSVDMRVRFLGGGMGQALRFGALLPACTARLEMPCAVLSKLPGLQRQRHGFVCLCCFGGCVACVGGSALCVPVCGLRWGRVGALRAQSYTAMRVQGPREQPVEGREQLLLHILLHRMSVHMHAQACRLNPASMTRLLAALAGCCCRHWIHLGCELPSTARAMRCDPPDSGVDSCCDGSPWFRGSGEARLARLRDL